MGVLIGGGAADSNSIQVSDNVADLLNGDSGSLQEFIEAIDSKLDRSEESDRYYAQPILGIFANNFPSNPGDRYINTSDPTQIIVVGSQAENFPNGAAARITDRNEEVYRQNNQLVVRNFDSFLQTFVRPPAPSFKIRLDGINGSDENDGFSQDVATLDRVKEILQEYDWGFQRVDIFVFGETQINSRYTFDGSNILNISNLAIEGNENLIVNERLTFSNFPATTLILSEFVLNNQLVISNFSSSNLSKSIFSGNGDNSNRLSVDKGKSFTFNNDNQIAPFTSARTNFLLISDVDELNVRTFSEIANLRCGFSSSVGQFINASEVKTLRITGSAVNLTRGGRGVRYNNPSGNDYSVLFGQGIISGTASDVIGDRILIDGIEYDSSQSGLAANKFQSAIDELALGGRYFAKPIQGVYNIVFPAQDGVRYIDEANPNQIQVVGSAPEPFPVGAVVWDLNSNREVFHSQAGLIVYDRFIRLPAGITNFYVSQAGSNSTGDGSATNPWGTILFALAKISRTYILNEGSSVYLNLADGTYPLQTLAIPDLLVAGNKYNQFRLVGNSTNPENVVLDFSASTAGKYIFVESVLARIFLGDFTIIGNSSSADAITITHNPYSFLFGKINLRGLFRFGVVGFFNGNCNAVGSPLLDISDCTFNSVIHSNQANLDLTSAIFCSDTGSNTTWNYFVNLALQGRALLSDNPDNYDFLGTVSGARFKIEAFAALLLGYGAQPNISQDFLPGTAPGVIDPGGQYQRSFNTGDRYYRSDPVSWVAGALLTFPHGWVDFDPDTYYVDIDVWAICTQPQYGYAVGDRIKLHRRTTGWFDANNIYYKLTLNRPMVARQDGNQNEAAISTANWDIFVMASGRKI